jgi:DNA-binding MarR family transcriptional regulator
MSLQEYLKFIQGVARIESEMPLQQLHCLLVIAQAKDGLSLTEIASKVGISLATASRYVAALGKQNRHREEGLLLIESFEDPMERRKKIIRLTAKGRTAINKLVGDLNADIPKGKLLDGERGKQGT